MLESLLENFDFENQLYIYLMAVAGVGYILWEVMNGVRSRKRRQQLGGRANASAAQANTSPETTEDTVPDEPPGELVKVERVEAPEQDEPITVAAEVVKPEEPKPAPKTNGSGGAPLLKKPALQSDVDLQAIERARAAQKEQERLAAERAAAEEAERYAIAAAQVHRSWDEKEREAQDLHNKQMMAVTERLERARRLVVDSGVGMAVVSGLELMWYWPALLKADEWTRPAGMNEFVLNPPSGEESDSHAIISWLWIDSHYRLDLTIPSNQATAENIDGVLTLQVEGEGVLAMDVARPAKGPVERWTMMGVDALRAGPWMPEFVEIVERLKSAEAEKQRQLRFERFAGKSNRVEFGEDQSL